ncbi:MAG: murein biosynthesis integral membrane protein MurJ [Caldilineales bacterium]|nr:murein biosynthesis integral membrane protein MurJ [Caldilineales bacterium]
MTPEQAKETPGTVVPAGGDGGAIAEQRTRNRHIALNTLLVGGAFLLAAAAGFLRNIVITRYFTIGPELDAYYAAFKLPDLLFAVVAGGALATAFIPVFADFLAEEDRQGAWRLASAITNLVVLIVAAFAALAALSAPWLVRVLIAPGFDPALQAETAALMRLVLISTILFGISSVESSVLQAFKHFLLPALAAVVYPLGIAMGALWLAPTMGVKGLAIGAVVGSVLHLAIKIPGLIHFGFRWYPVLDLRGEAVHRVFVLMGPRVLDLAVFQLTLILTTNLASRLGGGSVSALEWGWDVMQLPETLIGTAFGLVAFPTMAELAAKHDIGGLRITLGETLRAVIALTVPASLGLIILGPLALEFLYQRGSFDADAIQAIVVALSFFAVGLVGHSCLELVARAFFAQKDTLTPLYLAAASGAMSIGLGIVLMRILGHGGLALANSIAVSLEVLGLMAILRKRWGALEGGATLRTLGRVALASVIMATVMLLALRFADTAELNALVSLVGAGLIGLATYVVVCLALRERSLGYLPAAILGR